MNEQQQQTWKARMMELTDEQLKEQFLSMVESKVKSEKSGQDVSSLDTMLTLMTNERERRET